MKKHPASFRDPAGFVCEDNGHVFRCISEKGRALWEPFASSPFCAQLLAEKRLVAFTPTERSFPGAWRGYELERLPFISYPYEWCFSQLQEAALLTLDLQKKALSQGFSLRDATAYNVQFQGVNPIFIDHLSFESLRPEAPWDAYRQFCSHFLAPLALMAYGDIRAGLLSRLWIDGLPLDFTSGCLPWRARLRPALLFHIFLHARFQNKYADTRRSAEKAKALKVSDKNRRALLDSLIATVQALRLPGNLRTEWGDYYSDTNYSDKADSRKAEIVGQVLETGAKRRIGADLGANTGRYSQIMAQSHDFVISADIDPLAVERHYKVLKGNGVRNILPLVVDLSNPSPALGCNNRERQSFFARSEYDTVLALALIHHLSISAGLPFEQTAQMFQRLLKPNGRLVLEFVPKEDSQVQRLLASREDIFSDYSLEGLEKGYAPFFEREALINIEGSSRIIILMKKKSH